MATSLTQTKYTISTIQLDGTRLDGGGTVAVAEHEAQAQVEITNSVFSFKGTATVTKFERIPNNFSWDTADVEVFCIEAPEFWMVLVTNPFPQTAQPTASGSLAGHSGGIWSITGHA